MVNFIDVIDRATTGPMMTQKDFDVKVVIPTLRRTLKKYEIKYDRKEFVNTDDALADRIFEAAVDFYSEVGTYILDTERIIKFTKGEILEAVEDAPKQAYFGEGPDRCVMKGRMPDDNELPHCHVGSGTNTSEENALRLVESYARISKAKTISIPIINTLGHIRTAAGAPTEILAAIRAMQYGREGCRRAGRPGLGIIDHVSSASTGVSTIASSAPQFGARPSDGWLIAPFAELKTDYSSLNQTAYLTAWGANIGQEAGPLLGGYAGGPEGLAVMNTAYSLHGILVMRATYHLIYPIHMTYVCSSQPDVIWATSASTQAIAGNLRVPYYTLMYAAAGAATKMYFDEALACLIMLIASGSGIEDVHPGKAKITDGCTPVDMEFTCQVGHAFRGVTRKEANKLLEKICPKYVDKLADAPLGEKVNQCYDLDCFKPKSHFQKLYDEVIREIKGEYGIDLYKY
ncbi:MAG: monomethylamine:corrinoid methyltransferase [Spirochaetes bacterium]|nr:monomethylamine:corrinoid methyltransferase [Spirochaetota bacterium]